MTGVIIGILLGAIIFAYTAYIVYKKIMDMKAGKSCCGGCSSCASKDKCSIK